MHKAGSLGRAARRAAPPRAAPSIWDSPEGAPGDTPGYPGVLGGYPQIQNVIRVEGGRVFDADSAYAIGLGGL